MDEIVKGVIETTSLPENVEQLVKVNIKDGKASATLFANPNGSKLKQRLDNLEARFNNLKTINYEELYGPGNINIKQGGDTTINGATKSYVDSQDNATLEKAKSYTDSKVSDLKSYVDNAADTALSQAKAYADSLSYGGGDKSTVVLIDAVNRASAARDEAYTAYKDGKSIVLKCANDKFIPMTVVAESSNSIDLKGFDLSYSGYTVTPNVTLVTRMWTLDSKGLNYIEKAIPVNSCRTFDCTNTSNIANTYADAMDSYKNGFSIILKVDLNTYVIVNTITSTSLTGYSFSFNTGTTSDGQVGIVSVDIIRWRLTSSGLSKDTFSTTSGGTGGGGNITLRQAFSTKTTTLEIPNNPDDDPTFWNQSAQTSASVWAAQKSTGNDWVIWKLKPQDGTDGKGIVKTEKQYGKSTSSTIQPTDWSDTMPDAKPGEYIWTKVTFRYSDGTSDTYYTVSYVGKNGIDGKNGTSVNIIKSLSSKEELPTTGNTKGDGYLIDGNLWVYDGNTITSDITYNGFTNVGKISGPGACFHVAWCNGNPKLGDYTGFDVDAPIGAQFDYMGTYVDYPDNVSECPDSNNPADYKWTRIRGVDGVSPIRVDLDNENVEIALTHDGFAESFQYAQTKVAMFEGVTPLKITSVDVKTDLSLDKNVYLDEMDEYGYDARVLITIPENSGALKPGLNNVSLVVRATCLDGSTVHIATANFKINGVKAGAPGEDAVTYGVVPSEKSVLVKNGEYIVKYISARGERRQGEDYVSPLFDYAGSLNFKITYSKDGKSEVDVNENYNVDITDVSNYITFKIYVDGIERDSEKVWIIKANDGEDGGSAKVVDTKYEYAVAMSFTKTPADLTAWSENPIDVEPGQYLYVKIIRTWNNGEVTYDYTWTRGGLNGYSNLPFVSTVFMRSATQPSKPVGGDYNSPLPETDGWSDGVPDGTAKLWLSQRKFTIDGLEPQESEWSDVVSALSTSDLKIMYSSEDECPKAPNVAPTSVWSAIPDLNSKWMAMQKIVNGIEQNWVLLQIKGEGSRIDTTSAATPFMGEWDASTKYYGTKLRTDIVRVSGTSGADDPATYYYIANKAKNFDGVITPKPDTTEGDKYWLRFGANYDNLATGFLFSEKIETDILHAVNAHIDDLDVDSLDAKIVNAINNGEGIINADKINVDDLTAKRLKTADSGARIIIDGNMLNSYDKDGYVAAAIDPSTDIDYESASLLQSLDIDTTNSFYNRRTTTYNPGTNTATHSLGSFAITPITGKKVELYVSNLSLFATVSNASSQNVNNEIAVTNTFNVAVVATIGDKRYVLATGTLSVNNTYYAEYYIPLNFQRCVIDKIVSTLGCLISVDVSHNMTQSGSTTGYINQVYVGIKSGASFSVARDNGILIGKNALSSGAVTKSKHFVIGSNNYPIDIRTYGSGFRVSQDSVEVYNDEIRGYSKVITPYIFDIGIFQTKTISYSIIEIMVKLFKRNVPVYIVGTYPFNPGYGFYNVYVHSMLEVILEKPSSATGYNDVVLFFAFNLHDLNSDAQSSNTDYRVNVFINGTIRTSDGMFGKNGRVTTYLHTV